MNNRLVFCLSIAFVFSFLGQSVFAGQQTGTIAYVAVKADGRTEFSMVGGAITESPPCVNYGYWFIKDEKSIGGKQQYAMLLTAFASGKTVKIVGANTCDRWVDGEDVEYMRVDK